MNIADELEELNDINHCGFAFYSTQFLCQK